MASRSEEASLAPIDIYSSVINSWTQVWSDIPPRRTENNAIEESPQNQSTATAAITESSESCVCQRLKEPVILSEINTAATTGCAHCQILFDSILHFLPAIPEDWGSESWFDSISLQQNKYDRVVEVVCKEESFAPFSVEIFTNKDEYLGCDAIGTANLVTQPLSTEFFDKIREWVRECDTTHTVCIRTKLCIHEHPLLLPRLSGFQAQYLHNMLPNLPKRVLDVGKDHNDLICLKETNGEKADYITLSHCWGGVQHLTLTKSTLDCRKEGIAWSMLSRTFQDAIIITRGLKIRYIWIDSLCIMQDDPADWKAESEKMAAIYEHSWLTIAATAAANGTKGCFCVPNSEARLRNHQQVREGSASQQAIYARQLPEKRHDEPDEAVIGFSVSKPLMSRGWCFQERLLARRVLHICGEEIFWECGTHCKCECKRTEDETFKGRFEMVLVNEARDDIIVETWDGILARYLVRDLTFQKDRVPAITGVSEKFGRLRSTIGSCIAGHWEGWLLASLLWFVSTDGLFFPNGRNITYPSWSWASLNGSWSYARAPIESRFPSKILSTSWRNQPDSDPLSDSLRKQFQDRLQLKKSEYTQRFTKLLSRSSRSQPGFEIPQDRLWIKLQGRFRSATLEYTLSASHNKSVHPFQAQKPRLLDLDTRAEFGTAWVDTVLDTPTRFFASGTTVYLLLIQEEDIIDIKGCRGLILTPVGVKMNEDGFERLGIFHCLTKRFENCETRQITLV